MTGPTLPRDVLWAENVGQVSERLSAVLARPAATPASPAPKTDAAPKREGKVDRRG